MSLTEQIKRGTRVVMTSKALHMGLDGPRKRRSGVVVKVLDGQGYCFLRVHRDGLSEPETYHYSLWECE